nr:hypothetical protein WNSECMFO_WNSECMFO_CDS_0008 [Microvirus sp.]
MTPKTFVFVKSNGISSDLLRAPCVAWFFCCLAAVRIRYLLLGNYTTLQSQVV